jgi:hypothetical protein
MTERKITRTEVVLRHIVHQSYSLAGVVDSDMSEAMVISAKMSIAEIQGLVSMLLVDILEGGPDDEVELPF